MLKHALSFTILKLWMFALTALGQQRLAIKNNTVYQNTDMRYISVGLPGYEMYQCHIFGACIGRLI